MGGYLHFPNRPIGPFLDETPMLHAVLEGAGLGRLDSVLAEDVDV